MRRRIYAALILIVIIAIGIYFYFQSPPLAVNFTFQLSIQISNSTNVRFLGQQTPVGVAGFAWNNHTYDGQGAIINGVAHYPIYSEQNANPYPGFTIIHVASTVNRLYYLSDYFSVWGQPLGRNNTLGISSYKTVYWDMCIGSPPGEQFGNWGQQVLVPNLEVTLVYFNSTKGIGCH